VQPSAGGWIAMNRGRPSIYEPKLAQRICELLASDKSLVSICEQKGMPSETTVYRWRQENEDFREMYTRAREVQGHVAADVVGDIRRKIMDGAIDWQTGKAAADLAKWEASKRAARDYGDKLDLTSGGEKLGLSAELEAARKRSAE
jgi:hypothetical protein